MGEIKVKKVKKEYTLMLVPHHGKGTVWGIRLPMRLVQFTAGILGIVVVGVVVTMLSYRHTMNVASADKAELERLRQVNSVQAQQLEKMAGSTAKLQADMNRLNQLDSDLRRLVSSDESSGTSRSGVVRPNISYKGQGGPAGVKPNIDQINEIIAELQKQVPVREQSLLALRNELEEKIARLAATPSIWPANGDVTSRFGWRTSPWGGNSGDWHPGIDIANDYGTPIVATANGVVIYSGWYSGYGNMVEIDHGNGIVTIYGHNEKILVHVGQKVRKGETISYMGSTGLSTGPHVHYEVRVNGTAVNPAKFL
ncbi:M23 family metallopeptidase [Lucifera butyrica]|uniref:M23 family metallopeptidase n=1 Tax=Lucifera butyrica TaxID=1351585 RepID=UPI001FB3C440|nr:M23 family metallopeptidase [Lucifera butyrica]